MRAKSAGLLLLLGLIAPVTGCGTENETAPPVEQGGEAGTTTSPSPDAQGSAGEGGEGGEGGEEGTTTSPSPSPGGEGGEGGEG